MRFPTGVNRDRFNLITAVLAKHARLKVHTSVTQLQLVLANLTVSMGTMAP